MEEVERCTGKRVVADGRERGRDARKNALAIVKDQRSLAMFDLSRHIHLSPMHRYHSLMTKTHPCRNNIRTMLEEMERKHTQNGNNARKLFDDVNADARIGQGVARPWRDHDVRRFEGLTLRECDLIVSCHVHICP